MDNLDERDRRRARHARAMLSLGVEPENLVLDDRERASFTSFLEVVIPAGEGRARSLKEVLLEPGASLSELDEIKVFAKRHVTAGQESELPADFARALYFLVLAVAWRDHRCRLSDLSPDGVSRGWEWAASREWIDAEFRRVFQGVLRDESGEGKRV